MTWSLPYQTLSQQLIEASKNLTKTVIPAPVPTISPASLLGSSVPKLSDETQSISCQDLSDTAHQQQKSASPVAMEVDSLEPIKQDREYITELNQDGKLSLTIRKASNQPKDLIMDLKPTCQLQNKVQAPSSSPLQIPILLPSTTTTTTFETDISISAANASINAQTVTDLSTTDSKQSSTSSSSNSKPIRRSARLMQSKTKEKRESPPTSEDQSSKDSSASQPSTQIPAAITQTPVTTKNLCAVTTPPQDLQPQQLQQLQQPQSHQLPPQPQQQMVSDALIENLPPTIAPTNTLPTPAHHSASAPVIREIPPSQTCTSEALKENQPSATSDTVEPPPIKTRYYTRGKKVSTKHQHVVPPQQNTNTQAVPPPIHRVQQQHQQSKQLHQQEQVIVPTQLVPQILSPPVHSTQIQTPVISNPQSVIKSPQRSVAPTPPPLLQPPQPVQQQQQPQLPTFFVPSYLPPRKRLGWLWSQKQLLEQRYLVVWTSRFTLKDAFAAVQMHFIAGNNKMPSWSYQAMLDETGMPLPIQINQRMRLDPDQLEGVQMKMANREDHCVLLAVPVGRDQSEYLKQSTSLRVGFIDYLISKQAAGIVYVCQPGDAQPSYIIHIFPSCSFVNDHILRCEPDLLSVTQNIDNLIVVITTA